MMQLMMSDFKPLETYPYGLPSTQAVLQAGFGEGELVVLSLEAVPGRRPQPAVSRSRVVACDAGSVTLSLQRRLRMSIANPPAQVLCAAHAQ